MNTHDVDRQTEHFYSLLPHNILDAVEEIGLRCTGRCLALNSMENRVYEVEIEVDQDRVKSAHEKFKVVKFYRPGRWTKQQILEEHRFLNELAKNDIPVIAPLPFPDGNTLREVKGMDIWFTVFPKVAGRTLDELSDEQLQRIGRTLARLHLVGATHDAKCRLRLDPNTYGREALQYLLTSQSLPTEIQDHYSQVVTSICDIAEPWFLNTPIQRIHGDCHVGNVLWRDDSCFLVDFDDMLRGPCVQDIWLLTPGRDAEAYRQREMLLSGYEQMREFDRSTLGLIESLRALRIIHFSAWIAKRWEDPSFQLTFVEFGSMKYWKEQLFTLEEQLRIIQGAE